MSRRTFLPGMEFFESEPLFSSKLRDEPDWALVERITGKKCPETVSLRNLSRMTQAELKETLGLNDVQGKKLGAALVLGERLANEAIERGMSINGARDAFRIFSGQMKDAKKECFYAVTVDQKHQVIDLHRISEGSLSMTLVHPREAFIPVIRDSAAGVIFLHNHPSGNPEPSKDDYLLTERLAEAGNLLGIRVLDHVVIGAGDFVSLRDRGVDFERISGLSQAAESGYAGEFRESSGQLGQESVPSPSGRIVKETSVDKHQEQAPDFIVKDSPDTRLIFEFGSGNLKYMDLTLSSDDWGRMVENAGMGDAWHLFSKAEDGLSRLEGSFKNTDTGRLEALKERSRREELSGGGASPRFVVIAHEHFERAFPEMRKQSAENSRSGASSGRAAGQENPTRSAPASRRERGGMGF